MPGFNGTGPQGMGPMTGYGRGYCMVNLARRTVFNPVFYRAGRHGRQNRHCAGRMPRTFDLDIRHKGKE
jgi:hypothetical protein